MKKSIYLTISVLMASILLSACTLNGSKEETPKSVENPKLANLRVCLNPPKDSLCKTHTQKFKVDSEDLHATLSIPLTDKKETIEATWKYTDEFEQTTTVAKSSVQARNEDVAEFVLKKPVGTDWLIGKYVVEVSVKGNDKVKPISKTFEVIDL